MTSRTAILLISFIGFVALASKTAWPPQPTEASDPGSAVYPFTIARESIKIDGRSIAIFYPAEAKNVSKLVPCIIYGHGMMIELTGYELTFTHIARKGVAVAFIQYDSWVMDTDWHRMARDWNSLTGKLLQHYSTLIDPRQVVYSGHSKGAYIASLASGMTPAYMSSLVLFAPAGCDAAVLKQVPVAIPFTVVWSESDMIVPKQTVLDLYNALPVSKKQLIIVKNYPVDVEPKLKADHFFPLTKHVPVGGVDGQTPYHYFGCWKWLLGAAWDLVDSSNDTNTYIYGKAAPSTGIPSFEHELMRSWSSEH